MCLCTRKDRRLGSNQPVGSPFDFPQPADPIVKDFLGFGEEDGFLFVLAVEGLPMARDVDPLLGRFEFQAGLINRAAAFAPQSLCRPGSLCPCWLCSLSLGLSTDVLPCLRRERRSLDGRVLCEPEHPEERYRDRSTPLFPLSTRLLRLSGRMASNKFTKLD
jgi:hypothetical protein